MYVYKQKLCTNKREKNHLIETDTELTKMMESADNDCKTAAGRYILQDNKERNERKK